MIRVTGSCSVDAGIIAIFDYQKIKDNYPKTQIPDSKYLQNGNGYISVPLTPGKYMLHLVKFISMKLMVKFLIKIV